MQVTYNLNVKCQDNLLANRIDMMMSAGKCMVIINEAKRFKLYLENIIIEQIIIFP